MRLLFEALAAAGIWGALAWAFWDGLRQGKVSGWDPSEGTGYVRRSSNPGLYWFNVGVLGLIHTLSTAAIAYWIVRLVA